MNLFRLILVLALMPVTAYSGMPHVACRCSNGSLRLHCSKLHQAKKANSSSSECCEGHEQAAGKSCCCGSGAGRSGTGQREADHVSCDASGCQCTPVVLASDVGPLLTKVVAPEQMQVVLFVVPNVPTSHSHEAFVISKAIDTGPMVAMDFVLVYERILV